METEESRRRKKEKERALKGNTCKHVQLLTFHIPLKTSSALECFMPQAWKVSCLKQFLGEEMARNILTVRWGSKTVKSVDEVYRKPDTNSVEFSSVQSLSCVWLCNPMNHSTPGLPVHHQLPEFTQTHVHWVRDVIQPLLSPSPPSLNLSQHQGLFKRVSSLNRVAKVLEFQLQHQSFQWTPWLISFRMDWLDLLAVQGNLESSPTPQFKSINSSALNFLYSPTLTSIHDYWKNHSLD